MSSTPLFDAIARRSQRSGPAPTARLDAPAGLTMASAAVSVASTPASPLDAPAPEPAEAPEAPVAPAAAVVPADLVEVIDGIPASLRASLAREHVVCREQLPLVEAVVDAVTRAVVDAVAVEVERIVATGVVRV
ncbi:hypothetical protein [Curtobacterium sp. MCPF17_047]|uniref:hypothetical protein n=1 Tax=Curtobacterium sp. MCPF17_047 TaxID=2175654 RepID=UPI0011B4FC82|nr:hypothetical protein [Curtobacterium sp. MCPF17_047]